MRANKQQPITLKDWVKSRCIGLTGGIATGKSTVAQILRDLGYVVFDADLIAREVVLPNKPALHEIVKEFGSRVLGSDGTLDRKKLGALIWNHPEKKARLEAITHPRIKETFLSQVESAKEEIADRLFFYEAALIFEAGREQEFSKILCTWCPEDEQIRRLATRNQLSLEEARAMITNQLSAAAKRERADVIVQTDCPLPELKQRVEKALIELNN